MSARKIHPVRGVFAGILFGLGLTMLLISLGVVTFGTNAPFIEEQYENYLGDPASVSAEWREYFDKLQSQAGAATRDVAHGPIIAAFEQMAKRGPVRTVVSGGGEDKQQVSQWLEAEDRLIHHWLKG